MAFGIFPNASPSPATAATPQAFGTGTAQPAVRPGAFGIYPGQAKPVLYVNPRKRRRPSDDDADDQEDDGYQQQQAMLPTATGGLPGQQPAVTQHSGFGIFPGAGSPARQAAPGGGGGIPGFAYGGTLNGPGVAIVGEQGPEYLVNHGGGATVIPMNGGGSPPSGYSSPPPPQNQSPFLPVLPNQQAADATGSFARQMLPVIRDDEYKRTAATNFRNSVARNNAAAENDPTARTFAAAKTYGLNDADSRRQAYIARHGGASPYNVPSQPQGGAMLPVAPGAMGPMGAGTKTDNAMYGRANSFYGSKVGQAVTKLTALQNEFAGLMPTERAKRQGELNTAKQAVDDAYTEQQNFRGSSVEGMGYPNTPTAAQPQQQQYPAQPPEGMVRTPDQPPAGTLRDMHLTREQIAAMHQNNGGDASRTADLLQKYGYSYDDAINVLTNMHERGQLSPAQEQQYQPGSRTPLSMLGADNGLDPNRRYNAPRQAVAGPNVRGQGQVTSGARGPGGFTLAPPPSREEGPGISGAAARNQPNRPRQAGDRAAGPVASADPMPHAPDGTLAHSPGTNTYWRKQAGKWVPAQ